ncbi:MAG: metallophosphoesterase [Planctomycetota bacterium]
MIRSLFIAAALALLLHTATAVAHQGPDPIGSWNFNRAAIQDGRLTAVLGANGAVRGKVEYVDDPRGNALFCDGKTTRVVFAADRTNAPIALPERHLTIEAWVSINTPQRWGGIFGCLQDNGELEKGWILGYDEHVFTFGLSSTGADDGDGKMTYLKGKTRYEEGRFYHVVATFDGGKQRIYVNGKLDAESTAQSGDVLYPDHAPIIAGGYQDADESYFHHGRLRSLRIFNQTAGAEWVSHAYGHASGLTEAPPHIWIDPNHEWTVEPYLQWVTTDGITVCWETTRPAKAIVEYGEKVRFEGKGEDRVAHFPKQATEDRLQRRQQIRLAELASDQAHYYRVRSIDDLGRERVSPILSFQTAGDAKTPFAFAVISDTQGNPKVSGRIAEHAWELRPNFVLHPGDLVSTGSNQNEWIDQFFSSMKPLLERVAFFPVLGNHEQDARYYYQYMALPDPEHYYAFTYNNARFFLLDSNRNVGPGSEQYAWLERELAACEAQWKIVCYHHPSYTSDENDYGDTWSGPSTRGDTRVRALVPLYDKYGVDLVWNGHIHSYERTWPLKAGKPVGEGNGTVYMITGGGGGSLERAGPIRPPFQNNVRRGHHFCYVAVNGPTLELKSFDLEGRLFDTVTIRKQ